MNVRSPHEYEANSNEHYSQQWRRAVERNPRWAGGILLVLLILLIWYFFFSGSSQAPAKVHAIPVMTAKAAVQNLPVSITGLGAAQAWTSVNVFAQVSGKLLSVDFVEGTTVQAGQLLAEIDPAPYRAALTQAQGALKRDQALLANARIDLERYRSLVKASAVSNQVYETQAALVKQDEGTVLVDEGTVAAAEVNLGWCRITSPITGRVGVRLVDPGNLVSASGSVSNTPTTAAATSSASTSTGSGSAIVVINQIAPMAVTFTVPEGEFQRVSDVSDGFRKPMVVKASSQETGALLDTGELSIADNRVDPSTGSVELKARFPNLNQRLWPGQFVNVEIMLNVLSHATTIPVTAVNQGPGGGFVYVVGANHTVSMRPVIVAWTQGAYAAIKNGLRPGEIVVTDGQMILKPGSLVRVVQLPSAKR